LAVSISWLSDFSIEELAYTLKNSKVKKIKAEQRNHFELKKLKRCQLYAMCNLRLNFEPGGKSDIKDIIGTIDKV
jgi:hypothetical protein